MSHVYCPECGFQNPEAANYCARCGALLVRRSEGGEATMTFTPEEATRTRHALARGRHRRARRSSSAPAAAGRGRRSCLEGERTTIGRSPECEIFLDDVTVSRKHAVLVERDGDVPRSRTRAA